MAKYRITPSSKAIIQLPISIGHKAEKGVEAVEFDVTAWVETYGSGTLTVIMRRWGDAIPYPIALEIDENNKATWTLSDIDTAKAGMAYAQLSYIVGDEVVKKSDIYTFRVMDSLTGEGEPPEAYESWLEQLTHLAAEAMAEVLDIEGIVTDKTLTVDGGIADAKAAGDALALKADKSTTYTKTEVDQMIEDVEVETDTTLEVSGAPADSAETGRQIGLLKADLDASGITNIPVALTWEAGSFNSSGAERPTEGLIRTSNSVIVPNGEITGTFHNTFEGLEGGTVIARLRVQKPDESVQIVTVGSSNYDIPYTITVEPGSSVRFYFITSTGSEANLVPSDGNNLIENVYMRGITNVTQELADIRQNISDFNSIPNSVNVVWERGNISSAGNNSGSTSTTIIRTKSAVHIAEDVLQYEVPSGYTMTIAVYDGSTHKGKTADITGNGTFNLTSGHDIRLVLQKSNSDAIPTEDGYLVSISTVKELVESVTSVISKSDKSALENYMSFSIFQKFGVIGDSFASGSIHHPDDGGWTGNYDMSWVQILARSCGAEAVNFTKGGLSTKTWLTDATYGLSKLLSTPAQQLYIIALGINDNTQINAGRLTLGSISDVNDDYTQNPDTFFGNYGRIIGNIKAYAPYAKIACLSVARPNERGMDIYIQQIANKFGIPFIDLTSDPYFTSVVFYGSMFSSHPIVYGYAGMAKAIERLICLDVLDNTTYWGTYYGLVEADTSVNPEE